MGRLADTLIAYGALSQLGEQDEGLQETTTHGHRATPDQGSLDRDELHRIVTRAITGNTDTGNTDGTNPAQAKDTDTIGQIAQGVREMLGWETPENETDTEPKNQGDKNKIDRAKIHR